MSLVFDVKVVRSADKGSAHSSFLIFLIMAQYIIFQWERYCNRNAEFSAQMQVGDVQNVHRDGLKLKDTAMMHPCREKHPRYFVCLFCSPCCLFVFLPVDSSIFTVWRLD